MPYDGDDADNLVKYADLAMYRSKEKGGNYIQFYYDAAEEDFAEHLILDSGLREALKTMNWNFIISLRLIRICILYPAWKLLYAGHILLLDLFLRQNLYLLQKRQHLFFK
jgi:hypothetical protein